MRTLPMMSRAADYAPVAPACCNACRTCATTNVLGLISGGLIGLTAGVRRLVGRDGTV